MDTDLQMLKTVIALQMLVIVRHIVMDIIRVTEMSQIIQIVACNRANQVFEVTDVSRSLLVPNENYVLTKRFTTNEEKKRIVAAVYESRRFDYPLAGFENKVNYFHSK
jgi:hypothetical protein